MRGPATSGMHGDAFFPAALPAPLLPPTAQIVESHATLSFWGRHARILVIDSDEFFVPAQAGQTLASLVRAALQSAAVLTATWLRVHLPARLPARSPVRPAWLAGDCCGALPAHEPKHRGRGLQQQQHNTARPSGASGTRPARPWPADGC